MAFGLGSAVGLIGGGASLLGGVAASKAQKELLRRQRDIADEQLQLFRQAAPTYGDLLREYSANAGLGGGGGLTQTGQDRFQLGQLPQRPGGLGSSYGSVEDQLRLQAAEEDINRRQQMANNQFRFQASRMGLNQGAVGANLGRIAQGGQRDYAQFRRGLAINAGQERERRLAALAGLLGIGFGQGGAAQSVLGQQAAIRGQEATGQFSTLGNILQQMEYQRMLRQLGQQDNGNDVLGSLGLAGTDLSRY